MTAAALIIAIGAQNAYVLAQGVKRQHHWSVAGICMFGDILTISLGMVGAGVLIDQFPEVIDLFRIAGVLFLSWYGWKSFQGFLNPSAFKLEATKGQFKVVIATTLAVTFLNPHVYLDTVVLLGGIGNQYSGQEKNLFWIGAILASMTWFTLLTLTARVLAPYLSQPRVWRWVELLIGLMMWALACWLVFEAL